MSLARFFHHAKFRLSVPVVTLLIAACSSQGLEPGSSLAPANVHQNPDLAELYKENQRSAAERMAERRERIPDEVAEALDAGLGRVNGQRIDPDDWKDHFALKACREAFFKSGEIERDWTREEDCFLARTDDDFAEVAHDRHGVAFETARFVCAELNRIHADAKSQHWLEGRPYSDRGDQAFEDCYRFRVELALKALRGDIFGEGRDMEYVAQTLARMCLPACLEVAYGESVAAFRQGWHPDICASRNSMVLKGGLASNRALEVAVSRGLDPEISEQCIAVALQLRHKEAYRPAFDLCYLRHTDSRISGYPDGPFRFAEELAVSRCVNSFGSDRVSCIRQSLENNGATCRKAASTKRDSLSLAKVAVAEDVCGSVVPDPHEAQGRADIGIKAYRLCLDEQMWRLEHGPQPQWRRDGYPSNLFEN